MDEKEVFLGGSSIRPSLAQMSKKFLEPLGIKEGKNVDLNSSGFGKDRYSFNEKGIPVLDFFVSEPRRMHSSHDPLESIDFEKLAGVTKLINLTAYEFLTGP
jgi:acetylornithine deacetylase/succinyl-diaminopimelate desuccinylase-like protein